MADNEENKADKPTDGPPPGVESHGIHPDDLITDMEDASGDETPTKPLEKDEIDLDALPKPSEVLAEDSEIDDKIVVPVMLTCSPAEAADKIKALRDVLSDDDFVEQLLDPMSLLNGYRKIIENSTAADQYQRDRLEAVTGELLRKYEKGETRLFDATPVSNKDMGGRTVSGTEAQMLIQAKKRNLRRIFLYNSGFDIQITGPLLSELNHYYNQVSSETEEYGKEFGSHLYMFNDIIIKKATMEMVLNLISNATVKNWKRGQNFLKAMSILDYDVILWALGSLMHKEGFPFQYACTNPEKDCKFTEERKIDLKKIRWNDFTPLSDEAVKIIGTTEDKSNKDLAKYRKELGLSKKIKLYDNVYAVTQVPSMFEYLEYGARFNAALLDQIHLGNRNQLYRYIQFNYYKIFTPWIREIQYMREDKPETVDFKIATMDDIIEVLDIGQLEKSTFGEEIENFIKSAQISHIAIPFDKCPECGHVPNYVTNGLLPFDVQQNFFIQSVMSMAQSS